MKRKVIEKLPVPEWTGTIPKDANYVLYCQRYQDGIAIDAFGRLGYTGRYAMNTETGEYACFIKGAWSKERLANVLGKNPLYCSSYAIAQEIDWATEESKEIVQQEFRNGIYDITSREEEYGKDKRIKTVVNRYKRYEELMDRVKPLPDGFESWIREMETTHYTFKDAKRKEYHCSNCKTVQVIRKRGPKNNEVYQCPACQKPTIVKTRAKEMMGKGACSNHADVGRRKRKRGKAL